MASSSSTSTNKEDVMNSRELHLAERQTNMPKDVHNDANIPNESSHQDEVRSDKCNYAGQVSEIDYQMSTSADDKANGLVEEARSATTKIAELLNIDDKAQLDSNQLTQETTGSSSDPKTAATTIDRGEAQPNNTLPTDQPQAQTNVTTTVSNQPQLQKERHIMISYNHDTCLPICEKIDGRLKKAGYIVWRDKNNLHGNILAEMAAAVENSYIIILCINQRYQDSNYCELEAAYSVAKRVTCIPLIMEEGFEPSGYLAMITSNRKHIEFFVTEKFDESCDELVEEVKTIASRFNMASVPTNSTSSSTTAASASSSVNNGNMGDRINTIISEYKESIKKSHLSLKYLTKNELINLMKRICAALSPDTLPLLENDILDNDDEQKLEKFFDRLMQQLLNRDEQLIARIRADQDSQPNYARIVQCVLNQNEQILSQLAYTQQQLIKSYDRLEKNYEELSQKLSKTNEQLIQIIAEQRQRDINRDETTTTQLNQRDGLSTDIITGVAVTTILLVTMVALFRNN